MKSVGRYEVLEKLGQGGMGTVYKAFDPLLTRIVAIKVISGQLDGQPEHRERFFREARSAAQLSHKNIITIHDLGEQDGAPYLAMEYLEGFDLDRRLRGPATMTLAQKLDLALGIAEGLSHAHACGVVHRDIKPANVFVTNDGVVKLLDFGLARLVTSEVTRSAVMVGTVNYMSPEQLRGEKADHRADIFSFGVLLYELLGGRRPFQGDSAAATMYKILHETPEPLELIDPALAPPLTTVVERAIAKAREDRYQSMADLLRDLEAAYEPYRGTERRITSRVSAALKAVDPNAQTRLDLPDDAATVSDETVPVSDAWRLAQSNLPRVSATPPPAPGTPATPSVQATPATPPAQSTPAPPAPPLARSSPRLGLVAGTVALAALAIVGIVSLTRDTPQPTVSQQEDVAREPAPAPAPAPAPPPVAPPPPAPAPETVTPPQPEPSSARPPAVARPDTDSARDARATRQAREAVEQDRRRANAALATMEGSKAAAEAVNARELAAAIFASAEQQEALARADLVAGRFAAAAGRLDATVSLYRSAETTAKAEAEQRAARARMAEENRRKAEQAAPKPVVPAPPPPARVEAAPAPPPPAPTPPAGPSAQDAIAMVLQRYDAALEQRDVAALKAIWPGLSGGQQSAIESEFSNARSISVDLVGPRIQVTGQTATVVLRRVYQLRTRDNQQLRSETITTLTLRQSGTAWHIESVRHQPVN